MNQLTSQTGAADSASNDHRTSEELNSHRRMPHWTFVEGTPAEAPQHTPGPWFNYIAPHGTRHILPCAEPTLGTVQICTFNGSAHRKQGEEEANANLIAAAPDLLAALRLVTNDPSLGQLMGVTIASLRAAIAKAKGSK